MQQWLRSCSEPSVARAVSAPEPLLAKLGDDLAVFILNGETMASQDAFFDELSDKLGFPDYFGRNMNALHDCLQDGDVMPDAPVVIIVSRADALPNERAPLLIDAFAWAAEAWRTPRWPWDAHPRPFHAIFVAESIGSDWLQTLPDLFDRD